MEGEELFGLCTTVRVTYTTVSIFFCGSYLTMTISLALSYWDFVAYLVM